MKETTKNAFAKLSALTCTRCQECKSDDTYRCCDKLFCEMVDKSLKMQMIKAERPNVGGIPFMGEKGCTIEPHLRPMCSAYVCPSHLRDRSFSREYERIIDKINKDPSIANLPKVKNTMSIIS